jgi:dinuclear metal center YbgI/SA1388 family protein
MRIAAIISFLETIAPPSLQEQYDNAGLITGQSSWECSGIICSLDATEEVINEAVAKGCNLIVAHHPIVFNGLKKINGSNYVEKAIITAIKNDIAIYAIHTNLDNVVEGVNGKMAAVLDLQNVSILSPKEHTLQKLYTFVPVDKTEQVRNALFAAGAGHIGNYNECSFASTGEGSFKAGIGASPYVGEIGKQHREQETKLEVIFPLFAQAKIVAALVQAHPYEEVAYDIINLTNVHQNIGSGVVGELATAIPQEVFLEQLKKAFQLKIVRHTRFTGKPVKKVAVCGGAGSFLISKALRAGVDVFVTADMKYHEFFDANDRLLIADIGHYESEQFTIELLHDVLEQKFPTFAVLKTAVLTNPVQYS